MQLFLLFGKTWKKRYWGLLFAWAASIAYGQVYVGVHYVSDVVAGALLGMLLAVAVYGVGKALGLVRRLQLD
jgi:undecaprenyl-diphosphatase